MTADIGAEPRLIIDVTLEPLAGPAFQPTGFPDLGAAEFTPPGGPASLLVESVQSITNHLEEQCWDSAGGHPVEAIRTLPWLDVVHDADGHRLSSSREEPHRLAAAYIHEGTVDGTPGLKWVGDRLGLVKGHPLDWPAIYRTIFELDPLCLVHGVYFSRKAWHGNPKVRRAIAGVVYARDVAPVVSGGLKRDDVSFTHAAGGSAEEGYGFLPFGRVEYAARDITLRFVLDLAQIRGYGLGADETALLQDIALWEVARLTAEPIRFRTACDLDVVSVSVARPDGFDLPDAETLEARIAASPVTFAEPGRREVRWAPKGKKGKQEQ